MVAGDNRHAAVVWVTAHPDRVGREGQAADETDRLTHSMKVWIKHLTSALMMGFDLP